MEQKPNASERNDLIEITVGKCKNKHYFHGCCDGYQFLAEAYKKDSDYGAKDGKRVRMLEVWRWSEENGRKTAILTTSYHQGWSVRPQTEDERIVTAAIFSSLEQLPPRAFK